MRSQSGASRGPREPRGHRLRSAAAQKSTRLLAGTTSSSRSKTTSEKRVVILSVAPRRAPPSGCAASRRSRMRLPQCFAQRRVRQAVLDEGHAARWHVASTELLAGLSGVSTRLVGGVHLRLHARAFARRRLRRLLRRPRPRRCHRASMRSLLRSRAAADAACCSAAPGLEAPPRVQHRANAIPRASSLVCTRKRPASSTAGELGDGLCVP